MNIALQKISTLNPFIDIELGGFAEGRPKGKYTQHYAVMLGAQEVAFLALDFIPEAEYLVLYEIWVPKKLRHKGIGSHVIQELDRIAKDWGYRKIFVRPSPFENDYPESELFNPLQIIYPKFTFNKFIRAFAPTVDGTIVIVFVTVKEDVLLAITNELALFALEPIVTELTVNEVPAVTVTALPPEIMTSSPAPGIGPFHVAAAFQFPVNVAVITAAFKLTFKVSNIIKSIIIRFIKKDSNVR